MTKKKTSPKNSVDPFSEQELNKFHLRAPAQARSFLDSLNRTALEHDKLRSQRKLV